MWSMVKIDLLEFEPMGIAKYAVSLHSQTMNALGKLCPNKLFRQGPTMEQFETISLWVGGQITLNNNDN